MPGHVLLKFYLDVSLATVKGIRKYHETENFPLSVETLDPLDPLSHWTQERTSMGEKLTLRQQGKGGLGGLSMVSASWTFSQHKYVERVAGSISQHLRASQSQLTVFGRSPVGS
ncbi:hypothetical protein RRG08_018922 [Elysia crispata]|uniref:Uncharacterized protein n=1 Tax=Elysia crispata TaxID=231223 RepID=A0AAE1D1P2_9GAST|nr:hypothetical protein RRG08_018922 [Elysia crispata]